MNKITKKIKHQGGFTLVEALIYIVLFSVVIGGGVASSFYLIQSSAETRGDVMADAEANFVLRKVDYLLTSARTVDVNSGVLTIDKGLPTEKNIASDGADNVLLDGVELISDSSKLAAFDVKKTQGATILTIQIRNTYEPDDPGKFYETIHYLRR